ncbi:MAG: PD-(D/E)XK nuclease family protein [Firmicutes bacterium]|nr:PD-(D/E)XK nuclease family protein [Bacillota bacterium]
MEYLSFSRLSLLETCGLRFYYEYVLGEAGVDPVPMYHALFGKLVHSLYEAHANSGGELTEEVLRRRFDEEFPGLLGTFPNRDVAAVFYRKGRRAIHRFGRYRVNDVVASELPFEVEVSPDTPPVRGFVDRVIALPDGGYLVADLKTGRLFAGTDIRKVRQLHVYSIAVAQSFAEPARDGYFDFPADGQRVWVAIGEADRAAVRTWVEQCWDAIVQERFAPRFSRAYCSTYCPHRSRCPAYAQQVGDNVCG